MNRDLSCNLDHVFEALFQCIVTGLLKISFSERRNKDQIFAELDMKRGLLLPSYPARQVKQGRASCFPGTLESSRNRLRGPTQHGDPPDVLANHKTRPIFQTGGYIVGYPDQTAWPEEGRGVRT